MNRPRQFRCHPCGHEWMEMNAPFHVEACPVCNSREFTRIGNEPPHHPSGAGRHGRGGRHSEDSGGE